MDGVRCRCLAVGALGQHRGSKPDQVRQLPGGAFYVVHALLEPGTYPRRRTANPKPAYAHSASIQDGRCDSAQVLDSFAVGNRYLVAADLLQLTSQEPGVGNGPRRRGLQLMRSQVASQ